MSLAIVIATYRPGPAAQDTWDDLRVCLAAVAAYARGTEVVVAWDGPGEPGDLPANPACRLLARPAGMRSGTAWRWAIDQTDADELIVLSDDAVLTPDTVGHLLADAALVRGEGHPLGFLGCRSNFSLGPQNIRSANGGTWTGQIDGFTSERTVLRVERVSPTCALVSRAACAAWVAPDVEWFSDDIACFDLTRAGYTHWVSRAYVHHVGMRSSEPDRAVAIARLAQEATSWVREHRPDFWAHLQERTAAQDALGAEPAAPGSASADGPQPPLSVVMSVTDGVEATLATLRSVVATCAVLGHVEVVVVDNGSTDGTPGALAALAADGGVTVLRLDEPVLPRWAWLQGASAAHGQLVLFLSNDVRLTEGFLMPLVRSLAAGGTGAAPLLRSMDGDRASGSHDSQSGLCMLMTRADLASGRPLTVSAVREAVVEFAPHGGTAVSAGN